MDMPVKLEGEGAAAATRVVSLKEARQRFDFVDVPGRPVPSIARNFSAPVIVRYDYDERSLTHLMAHDSDPFNRWEAGQRLATLLANHARPGRRLEQVAIGHATRAGGLTRAAPQTAVYVLPHGWIVHRDRPFQQRAH